MCLQIDALIEDLGLKQVKHTRVADLTLSEKQRLSVACNLLLDTDIVMLDQVGTRCGWLDTHVTISTAHTRNGYL